MLTNFCCDSTVNVDGPGLLRAPSVWSWACTEPVHVGFCRVVGMGVNPLNRASVLGGAISSFGARSVETFLSVEEPSESGVAIVDAGCVGFFSWRSIWHLSSNGQSILSVV